jgi:DNA polymerase/3'-5' exonuclease PolX
MLERLRGEADPIVLLMPVHGISRIQAERLHHELGIDSLKELEAAAQDGRLSDVAGFGRKRTAGIIDSLTTRLDRVRKALESSDQDHVPVAELLDVDLEYRELAEAGGCTASHTSGSTGEAWLPILHTRRGEREYIALFSNTARTHGQDWDGESGERQTTGRYGSTRTNGRQTDHPRP